MTIGQFKLIAKLQIKVGVKYNSLLDTPEGYISKWNEKLPYNHPKVRERNERRFIPSKFTKGEETGL